MDNASKAIIIAGGFMIGMLIISVSMYIISSFRTYYEATEESLREKAVAEYNSFFEAYPFDSTVSGDVAFSFYNKCVDINSDIDSEYETSCTVQTKESGTVKQIFFFTEYFEHTFNYRYFYDNSDGHIYSITFKEE